MYKRRFENLSRVAKKVTSSLNIGDILEIIRDEAKATIPYAKEACLLIVDPEAARYARPLHCGVYKDRLNCQLCKRGKKSIQKALAGPTGLQCVFYEKEEKCWKCSLGLSTLDEAGKAESCAGSEGVDAIKGKADPVLCDIAVPIYDGDILVGPETALRIREKLALYDRGLSRFKNVKEEVRVFSLVRGSAENL